MSKTKPKTTQPDHLAGLPPLKSEDAKKMRLRLEASREWLKDYHARRDEAKKFAETAQERAE